MRGVSKTYVAKRGLAVTAVDGVDLEVDAGEFLVITGRSGSGKTTLLNLIAGLTTPTAGRILLDGVDLWSFSDADRSRLRNERVGFVFQFPSLLPTLTTMENVVLPATFGVVGAKNPGAPRAGAGAPHSGGSRRQALGLPAGALGRTATTGRARPVHGEPAPAALGRRAVEQPR